MNVLFLTMLKVTSIKNRGIYTDLYREFVKNGHDIYIISPSERREKLQQRIIKEQNTTILRVNTLNLQKTSLVEKGIGQLFFEYQFLKAIKTNFSKIKFDLIVYSTPPITFSKVISYIKKKDNVYSYLLLKDIFPQNAVDLKMLKENGKLHKFFLKKEKKLYEVSDKIGCMSPANAKYVLEHNNWVKENEVEVNPNSIDPIYIENSEEEIKKIRKEYNIPQEEKVFIYGGNLGKPQGIDFLLSIIENSKDKNCFFVIVGTGTEFVKIKNWFLTKKPKNALLLENLQKTAYDRLLSSCDVGMIFLHKDFTIPNFPSRLLPYLELGMPVFAATDKATDIGNIIDDKKCGYGIITGNLDVALDKIDILINNEDNFKKMKLNAVNLLKEEYHVEKSYKLILKAMKQYV